MKLVNVLSGDIVKESENLEELKQLGLSIALHDGIESPHWNLDDASSYSRPRKKSLYLSDEEGALFRIFLPK
ncbi:hypothetical protein [Enterovibrio calviensis]|uniref:hypothetical protein n=1 Tax=Enterovibrio calviensis TaxID=91359 RepID=UPI0004861477|nr:hypothetical protein [Enterovibrio calviensis]